MPLPIYIPVYMMGRISHNKMRVEEEEEKEKEEINPNDIALHWALNIIHVTYPYPCPYPCYPPLPPSQDEAR
jgi:hypothetical protein